MSNLTHTISGPNKEQPLGGPISFWAIRELGDFSDEAFWTWLPQVSEQRRVKILRLGAAQGANALSADSEPEVGTQNTAASPSTLPFSTASLSSSKPEPISGRCEVATKQKASLLAYITLWDLLKEAYGLKDAPLFEYEAADGHGKPFLAEHPEIHFSISHTSNAVLAVVGNAPVGADIQAARTPSPALLARVLAPEERRAFEALDRCEQALAFAQTWTHKEARLKMSGRGIRSVDELKSITYDVRPGRCATRRHDAETSDVRPSTDQELETLSWEMIETGRSTKGRFAWSICSVPDAKAVRLHKTPFLFPDSAHDAVG